MQTSYSINANLSASGRVDHGAHRPEHRDQFIDLRLDRGIGDQSSSFSEYPQEQTTFGGSDTGVRQMNMRAAKPSVPAGDNRSVRLFDLAAELLDRAKMKINT